MSERAIRVNIDAPSRTSARRQAERAYPRYRVVRIAELNIRLPEGEHAYVVMMEPRRR